MTTRTQRAVLELLQGRAGFLSAQDIHQQLRAAGSSAGLSSVYRAVQQLRADDVVDELRTPGGDTAYRLCGTDAHHHHLSCTTCGATVEVQAPGAEAALRALAERHGYRLDSHVLELTGTCTACRDRDDRRKALPTGTDTGPSRAASKAPGEATEQPTTPAGPPQQRRRPA